MTEQEEFEFHHRLEQEAGKKAPVSMGGVLAEGAKGAARGVSDVAMGVGRAGANLLFGPILGEQINKGLETLTTPSHELIKARPENKAEQFAGTVGEIGGAGVVGGGAGSAKAAVGTALSALGGGVGEQVGSPIGKLVG